MFLFAMKNACHGVRHFSVEKWEKKGNLFYASSNWVSVTRVQVLGYCAHAARCRYNAVNFLQNLGNRHSIARLWGRDMGCLLWFAIVTPSVTFLSLYISHWWRQTLYTCLHFTVIIKSEAGVSTEHGIKLLIHTVDTSFGHISPGPLFPKLTDVLQ